MKKPFIASVLASAIILGTPAMFPTTSYAATVGEIERGVSLRTGPSTDNERIRYLKEAEEVTILEETNRWWYKVKDRYGNIGYTSTNDKYISVSSSNSGVSTSSSANVGEIVRSVSMRTGPGTDYKRIRYIQDGERVTVLEETNRWWYKVRDRYGNVGYTSTSDKYISVKTTVSSSSGSSLASESGSENVGQIVRSVSMRTGPSTDYPRIRYVQRGEEVTLLAKPNQWWYQVQDSDGNIGYVSTSERYIDVNFETIQDLLKTSGSAATSPTSPAVTSADVEKVIAKGMEYLGTPYEFGSSRSNNKTFDCSDFVRTAFKESVGLILPSNSRSQAEYVRNKGNMKTSWEDLKPGDIMFFMSYEGSSPSDYDDVNKSTERVTHNGIYLGDGKVLHTYSKDSGGVRIDTIENRHWEYRFLYGGSAF